MVDAFYCHLSVRRYRDIELHVVDRILETHDLSDPDVLYNLRERVKMRTVDELSRDLTGRSPDPASALYTGQVAESCPRDETGITNSEITARQQAPSEEIGGQNETIPPMF